MQYKRILGIAAALTLAACSPAAVDQGDSSSSAAAMPSSAAAQASSAAVTSDARIIDVVVSDWAFTPSTITAAVGENVQLRFTGDKGMHGVAVPDLGINVRIASGESAVVDVPTDTAGTFAGKCNVPCGPGHRDMTFSVVVQ